MKYRKLIIVSYLIFIFFSTLLYFLNDLNLINWILFLLLFTVTHLFLYVFITKIKNEYDKLNQTFEDMYNDKIDAQIVSKYVSYRRLNANLNRIAKKIEKMAFKKEEDELTIKILTNNITSPIIYIDRDGRIRYVNHQFLNSFDANIEINNIYETLRVKKIYQFIDHTFINETIKIKTIKMNDKYYQANAIPIHNKSSNFNSFIGIVFIFHDITELKKYEKLQREFLADASHELKTPLSAIKGASEILLDGETHSKETIHDFLTIIKKENERMERIVRDILLISRLESESISINTQKIELKNLISSVVEILQFRLDAKKQKIHLDIDNLIIQGDERRLKHVFLNLISNAISYTNENKSIFVKTYEENNFIKVSIKDEGIGIDAEDIPFIFERFYRVDKARGRETGGTGLGLAIVKSILDIHQAKIDVISQINEGTEFIISFRKQRR